VTKRHYPTAPCADCGEPAKLANKLAKYCDSCRLGRGAQWHDLRSSECQSCSAAYTAWTGARAMRLCGTCFLRAAPTGGKDSRPGRCHICAQDGILYSAAIKVCWPCLTAPENARQLKEWIVNTYELKRRQHERDSNDS
jgi:hypothetical protein